MLENARFCLSLIFSFKASGSLDSLKLSGLGTHTPYDPKKNSPSFEELFRFYTKRSDSSDSVDSDLSEVLWHESLGVLEASYSSLGVEVLSLEGTCAVEW